MESRTWNLASHLDRFSGLEKDPGDHDGDGAAGSGVLPPESTSSKDSQAPPKKSKVAKRPAASKKTHEVALEEPQRTEYVGSSYSCSIFLKAVISKMFFSYVHPFAGAHFHGTDQCF